MEARKQIATRQAQTEPIPPRELFLAFLSVSLRGFGGVLPWARRALVEEKKWLDEKEFAETLALCQFLPGPNVVNVSVVVGERRGGRKGAAAAFLGLLAAPAAIVILLGILYEHVGHWPSVQHALRGITAAAAGLVFAMAAKMARAPFARYPVSAIVATLAFCGAGALGLPLVWVLAAVTPLSLFLAWRNWI